MATEIQTAERQVVLVEDAHVRPMMGLEVLEPVPSRSIPYTNVDPFVLVHEATVPITPERARLDTTHPHRGFDNLWYILSGSASTGHSTGPDGTFERVQLRTGGLLKIRTGRGVYHAENIGEDELRDGRTGEFHSVLFWVNLARKDKQVGPTAQVLEPEEIPTRTVGDATIRTLVGPGSSVELGTPALILDVELPNGGAFSTPVAEEFNGFVWVLDGDAAFGANGRRAGRAQIALLGPGEALGVTDARPGTRFMLMAGKPYDETPIFNGPYVD
jgi:redox-sensitive bicupin YhaK (pirin superfamily)